MTSADIGACHRLSQQLQWPHRLQDWQFLHAVGHGFVIESRHGEQTPLVVGTAMHFNFGRQTASFGLVIVQPEMQGHGLGRRLMQTLLDHTEGRVRLLNATEAGRPLYEKLGFAALGATHQYQGAGFPPMSAALPVDTFLRPLVPQDLARITALDMTAAGMDRSHVLQALSGLAEGVAIERAGELVGFAMNRPFGYGRLIGPVVAPDMEHAKALIAHWISTFPDDFIRIDVPASTGLGPWLEDIGLKHVDSIIPIRLGSINPALKDGPAKVQLFAVIAQATG